jgi:cell division protein FtsA
MAKGDLIVGLDIGTTKILTMIAEVGDAEGTPIDRLSVVGVGSAPSTGVRRGVIVDIESTAQAIRESVDAARRMAGADVHSAIVGVTGEHIASLNSRGVVAITHANREVTQEDVDRVMENSRVIVLPPDREIIHALSRGYSLDGQNGIRSPVGMCGTRLEVDTHIVTGATTFLRNVVSCVERAGLHVEDMVLEPIATGEAVLLDAEKSLGVALFDIGGGTSDLAIFRGGDICYSAIVPVGGDYVTRDISAGLRVSHEEAERIKIAYGRAQGADLRDEDTFTFQRLGAESPDTLPLRDLTEIIGPRVQEIFHLLQAELQRSGFAGRLPAGLTLSGGGALLLEIRPVAAGITRMPTRLGVPRALGGLSENMQTPSYATGVGLIRWGALTHAGAHIRRAEGGGFIGALQHWIRRVLRDVLGH